ncbi:MAG TPA: PIG-L family deacetylase [Vicinamibacterales bacterium]|nr:PIG-L family deacetylase [Vicinamibacterales bacterium]
MIRSLAALIGCTAILLVRADAQVRPVYDTGAAGLVQLLQRLQTTASVLHTGAHPDDEDSAFLARAARGDHARVAYLSLNRGEGGQNIIGDELFDALGVIRTEELLQARRLDGGEQFFTRTFDFGFSKRRDEAAMRWNEREVLGDMVRVIRTFRPLVIYSRWGGTSADGHGHHQLAGYLTPLAFKAAADPNEFPEQLEEGLHPWQTRKLYSRPLEEAPATIQVQTGTFDPALGRTYAEIAFEGRSQHKSQNQGTIETLGPLASGLRALEAVVTVPNPEQSIFEGLDVSIAGLAKLSGLPDGTLRTELAAMDAAAKTALRDYQPLEPSRITTALGEGIKATRAARQALSSIDIQAPARADADLLLALKEQDFTDAIIRAAGVVVDPLADTETVVASGRVGVNVRVFLAQPSLASVGAMTVKAPETWTVTQAADRDVQGGRGRREVPNGSARFEVNVPARAPNTQPYFLELPRVGDSYRWPPGSAKGAPFAPSLLIGEVALKVGDVNVVVSRPVQYRFADPIRGELRRPVNVVPRVTIGLDTNLLIVPLGNAPRTQRVVARVTSGSPAPVNGTLRLRIPAGWSVSPQEATFTLRSADEQTSAAFTLTAPANRRAGRFDIDAEARVGDAMFSRDVQVISYPHIQTHRLYWPAHAAAQVVDLKVAPVKVGYVMGGGDEVPDAIRRMGVDVSMVDADMLATGDLSQFDTIVVGIRASETRPDFVANNARLLQYVERGGTLIVQYQQGEYVERNMAPYVVSQKGNPRVTDETAAVKILAPGNPVFTFPNRITGDDFSGWVQERNLYAFADFDKRYTPLLESADAGEPPQRGGELYAEVGKGRYIYTAYSWFRQLPAGVPGAYRQFANLISLSKAPR